MCTTCGCGDPEIVPVELHEKILAGNDRAAAHNREHFLEQGVLALNLMGSPGSGKTAVLEATARLAARHRWRLGAVSADLATDNDARRLERAGIPARSITTGQACHLDAELVHRSLHGFPWREMDVFFIENVGNLVCPAIYDLGQRANVVVLSIAEGEDKPLKYPVMFKAADLVLLTKCDLAPHLDVSLPAVHDALSRVMPRPRVIEVSARTGQGLDRWMAWLEELRRTIRRPSSPRDHDRKHEHAHEHGHPHGRGGEPGHRHPPAAKTGRRARDGAAPARRRTSRKGSARGGPGRGRSAAKRRRRRSPP
jgi:hydrogenase nickel incorporation protein HypB